MGSGDQEFLKNRPPGSLVYNRGSDTSAGKADEGIDPTGHRFVRPPILPGAVLQTSAGGDDEFVDRPGNMRIHCVHVPGIGHRKRVSFH